MKVPVEFEGAIRLANVVDEVRSHEGQRKDRHVKNLVVKRNVGHIAGDDVVVDRHMIETMDSMPVGHCLGQLGLATAEVAYGVATSLLAPTDHLFVRHNRPV